MVNLQYPKKIEDNVADIMADIGLRTKLLVKDVMTSPAVTIDENAPANRVAELMDKDDLGSIIVNNKQGKPLGIITERDLVIRVLVKNVKPDTIRAKDIMTAPLMTIESDATITEAARRMSRLNIRRLGVIYKNQIAGLLSSKDILGVMPELIETIQERAKLEPSETEEESSEEEKRPLTGYCDRCGRYSDNLKEINGQFICEDCRVELEEEEEE